MFELKIDKPVSKSHEENIQNKYYKKVIKPTVEDLEIHKKFLKSEIKKTNWPLLPKVIFTANLINLSRELVFFINCI